VVGRDGWEVGEKEVVIVKGWRLQGEREVVITTHHHSSPFIISHHHCLHSS